MKLSAATIFSCLATTGIASADLVSSESFEDMAEALEAIIMQEDKKLEAWEPLKDLEEMQLRRLEDVFSFDYEYDPTMHPSVKPTALDPTTSPTVIPTAPPPTAPMCPPAVWQPRRASTSATRCIDSNGSSRDVC